MIDLSTIPAALLENRGSYATVRSAHEDSKKELSILCGSLSHTATQVLRRLQPDNDAVPESVDALFATARLTLDKMEACAAQIESLATQRAALKPLAWPK
jgi:hypothetical protein